MSSIALRREDCKDLSSASVEFANLSLRSNQTVQYISEVHVDQDAHEAGSKSSELRSFLSSLAALTSSRAAVLSLRSSSPSRPGMAEPWPAGIRPIRDGIAGMPDSWVGLDMSAYRIDMRFLILSSMRFLFLSRGVGPAPGFANFEGARWAFLGA